VSKKAQCEFIRPLDGSFALMRSFTFTHVCARQCVRARVCVCARGSVCAHMRNVCACVSCVVRSRSGDDALGLRSTSHGEIWRRELVAEVLVLRVDPRAFLAALMLQHARQRHGLHEETHSERGGGGEEEMAREE
jgi:hypothetical protein